MQPEELLVPGVEVEHRYVDARGLRTHVALAGPEGGDPVVLVHGWPQHWWIWRGVLPALVDAGLPLHLRRPARPRLDRRAARRLREGAVRQRRAGRARRARRRALQADRPRLGRLRLVPDRAARAGARREAARALDHPSVDPARGRRRAAAEGARRRVVPVRALRRPWSGPTSSGGCRSSTRSSRSAPAAACPPTSARSTRAASRSPTGRAAPRRSTGRFLLRELQPILKGRYRDQRLTVPTVLMFGDSDRVITERAARGLRGPRRRHAAREGRRTRPLPAGRAADARSPSRRSRSSAADAEELAHARGEPRRAAPPARTCGCRASSRSALRHELGEPAAVLEREQLVVRGPQDERRLVEPGSASAASNM